MDYTGTEVHAWSEEGAPVTRPVGVLNTIHPVRLPSRWTPDSIYPILYNENHRFFPTARVEQVQFLHSEPELAEKPS